MTKNNLVIVESPAKAKTIGRYLGNGYTVKASMGHVRDLPKSKIGIDFDHDFQPDYQRRGQRQHLSRNRPGSRRRSHLLAPEGVIGNPQRKDLSGHL